MLTKVEAEILKTKCLQQIMASLELLFKCLVIKKATQSSLNYSGTDSLNSKDWHIHQEESLKDSAKLRRMSSEYESSCNNPKIDKNLVVQKKSRTFRNP